MVVAMKKTLGLFFAGFLAIALCLTVNVKAGAATSIKSGIDIGLDTKLIGYGMGEQIGWDHWEGIPNVAQFKDEKGSFCIAVDGLKTVQIIKFNADGTQKSTLELTKPHPDFGTIICDTDGCYYMVTGEENKGGDRTTETVFISKFSPKGKLLKTVGDDGSSSLAYYYTDNYYTQKAFETGNCSAAINDGVISVIYSRLAYSGSQSCSVFSVDLNTFEKVKAGVIFESHSFAQRVIAYKKGFAYVSEGDYSTRAFMIYTDKFKNNEARKAVFHFWMKENAFNNGDMLSVNNNYARLANIVNFGDKTIGLIGTSAKSLNSNAETETEQLFIQIFDPDNRNTGADAYVTKGERSGLSGENGTKEVTDYGMKWLTNFGSNTKIWYPQAVSLSKTKVAILFEKFIDEKFVGTYYMVVSNTGKVLKKAKRISTVARLNPFSQPVYANKRVYWAGNKDYSLQDTSFPVYLFGFKP